MSQTLVILIIFKRRWPRNVKKLDGIPVVTKEGEGFGLSPLECNSGALKHSAPVLSAVPVQVFKGVPGRF